MISKIKTFGINGSEPILVETEVDISSGFPRFEIIGLPDSSIREAKHRVKTAIQNSQIKLISKKIIINLSPAEIKKIGSHYDLSIAIGILISNKNLDLKKIRSIEKTAFIGELSLNGDLKPTKGILAMCLEAYKKGIKTVIIPNQNSEVISLIKGIEILAADNLLEVINYLNFKKQLKQIKQSKLIKNIENNYPDFSEVKGQKELKRALEIAVAGNHNCLIIGPPGNGKTMLAKRTMSIMPNPTYEEILEINKIYNLVELRETLKTERPFISPHYSITKSGLIGGVKKEEPGALALSNNGILFLDELLEFDKTILELLRIPLEEKKIVINKNNKKIIYPCNPLLILAMNPCKCGYRGTTIKECTCKNSEIKQYVSKLSGAIRDRIEITIETSNLEYEEIKDTKSESSKEIKERIIIARNIQKERYKGTLINTNSELEEKDLEKYCNLDQKAEQGLKEAFKKYNLSIRSYITIKKIGRTIADLEKSKNIQMHHIIEAIKYNTNLNKYIGEI